MKPAVMSTIKSTPSPSRTPSGSFGSLSRYRSLRHDECGDDRRSLPGEPSGRPSQHTPQPVRGGAQTTPGVQPRAEFTLESGRTTPMPNANGSRRLSSVTEVPHAPAVHPLVGDNRTERVQPGGAVAHREVLCEHVAVATRPLAVKVAARFEVDGTARRMQVHRAAARASRRPCPPGGRVARTPRASACRKRHTQRAARVRCCLPCACCSGSIVTSSRRRCPQAQKRSAGASAEFSGDGSDQLRRQRHRQLPRDDARPRARGRVRRLQVRPVRAREPLQLRLRRLAVLALVRVVGIRVVVVVAELDELLEEPVRHVHESCAERGGRSPRAVRDLRLCARSSR